MKPEVDRLLEVAAAHLMMKTAPALGSGYEQSSAVALGALLMTAREENDRGAARRVEENTALRSLFAEALGVVEDAELRARLSHAAGGRDESLRLEDLEKGNGILREHTTGARPGRESSRQEPTSCRLLSPPSTW